MPQQCMESVREAREASEEDKKKEIAKLRLSLTFLKIFQYVQEGLFVPTRVWKIVDDDEFAAGIAGNETVAL